MKRLILLLLLFIGSTQAYSQKDGPEKTGNLTPNGYLDILYDHYGNKYKLSDVAIKRTADPGQETPPPGNTLLCQPGIFNLYFEAGCGMDNTSNANDNLKRAVLCKVFEDLSNFLVSPLHDAGNTTRVNIWIRNIDNMGAPPNVLGMASSFYIYPAPSSSVGGIIDGEIWKTIHAGVDSYTNIGYPLVSNTAANVVATPQIFFHGLATFSKTANWHTDLTIPNGSGSQDLYSVALHEVTHALGFASLIHVNGYSRLGTTANYYNRYDRFLRFGTNPLLHTNSGCTMYNHNFNNPTVPLTALYPACATVDHTWAINSNHTECATAVHYIGSVDVPVYTPNCFEGGSTLSHFEDECFPPDDGNNNYFVMSDSQQAGLTKRALMPEERQALCDIGYPTLTTYGGSGVFGSSASYTGGCAGTRVAGIIDGINAGVYTFTGMTGTPIPIFGILNNDYINVPANLGFTCLEDVYDMTATFSATSGTASTVINFTTQVPGIHLLRYVPFNTVTNEMGNITYIYVSVANNCSLTDACSLVRNGGFEEHQFAPSAAGQIERACGWQNASTRQSADYFSADATSPSLDVPCSQFGYEFDNVGGHSAYAGMYIMSGRSDFPENVYSESIKTELSSPLTPNTTYILSFDVTLAEMSMIPIRMQAYFSLTDLPLVNGGIIPTANLDASMLFTNATFSTQFNGWETITISFTTGATAGQRYLYLGGLKNVQFGPSITTIATPGCTNFAPNANTAYYFLDNVRLEPQLVSGVSFNLPESMCVGEVIPDLTAYLSEVPPNGSFSGTGVFTSGSEFGFDAGTGSGEYTITYTFTNEFGCQYEVSDAIKVVDIKVPFFEVPDPICYGTAAPELPDLSLNDIHGVWEPATVSNTETATYTFIPDAGQCMNPVTITVVVLQPDDPACKECPNTLVLGTPEGNSFMVYQRHNWIMTQESYTISGSQDITMRAGDYVMLMPNTFISTDKQYIAYIYDCCIDCARDKRDAVKRLTLYPNPSSGQVDLRMENQSFGKVIVATLDGRTIFETDMKSTNAFSFDVSSYSDGIYMIMVIADDGQIFTEKLIKN